MLNSLPLILDDTSKVSKRLKDQLEGLIYDLCSGKGKSRSNKALGINRENTWSCSILTCGERPLQDYAEQGGAINRIIEIQCGDNLYDDPHETAEFVKKHYGHLGWRFVKVIADLDADELERRRKGLYSQIAKDDKMQKQAYAMSVVMLADRIAEEGFFRDGVIITPDEAIKVMTDREAVSDNQRAYEFLLDKIEMDAERFNPVTDKAVEQWGFRSDGCMNFYPAALDGILGKEGYGVKPFLAWLDKHGLLDKDEDGKHMAKKVQRNGKRVRVYRIRLPDENQAENAEGVTDCQEDYSQAALVLSDDIDY